MASSSADSRAYPKRKRAVVSYFDDSSDGNGFSEFGSEIESEAEEIPARKVSHLFSTFGP